jgi:hypothetical protein
MLLDAGDLAVWCCAATDDADTSEDTVIPGVALAAEAGARLGLLGFVVPAVNATVAVAVRSRRGHRLRLEQFSWQLMGVAGGWMLTAFARRRQNTLEREHETDLRARLQGAELAGIHDLVTINEGAIDVLQRATALLDLGASGSQRRRDLAGAFKADVAKAARSHATYLRDALMLWQTGHNSQPQLSRTVSIELAADDGTILLSARQVGRLHAELNRLDPAGRVWVAAADRSQASHPYGDRDLKIDSSIVALPGDTPTRAWTFDAIPTAFLMGIGWLLQPMGKHREAVPFSATVVPLAMTIGAAAWSARHADRHGTATPGVAVGLSFATTVAYTVTATRAMRNPRTNTVSRFPWTLALQGYELVRSSVSTDLDTGQRRRAATGTAAIIGLGWALTPRPRSVLALAAELQWVVGTVMGARQLQGAIHNCADQLAQKMSEQDDRAIAVAYQRGRASANATIAAALATAGEALTNASRNLDPELRAEAERRLHTAAHLLNAG